MAYLIRNISSQPGQYRVHGEDVILNPRDYRKESVRPSLLTVELEIREIPDETPKSQEGA